MQSVDYLLAELPADGTIGVVTPFASQARLLAGRLPKSDRIQVGTVHTFQGSQRDVVLFSLVATKNMRVNTRAWLNSQLFLWNVAITRAKSHLIIVGDSAFWRNQPGIGGVLVGLSSAAAGARSGPEPDVDPLVQRLFERLNARGECKLFANVSGYRVDAVVDGVAVLLDRGYDDIEPARHLRLYYERERLLASRDRRVIRLPAWRLFDESTDPLQEGRRPNG